MGSPHPPPPVASSDRCVEERLPGRLHGGPPTYPDLTPLPSQLPARPAALLPAHGPPEQPLLAHPRLPSGPAPVALPGEEHRPATRWREHAGRRAWAGVGGVGGWACPFSGLGCCPVCPSGGKRFEGGSLGCPRHHRVPGPARGLDPLTTRAWASPGITCNSQSPL